MAVAEGEEQVRLVQHHMAHIGQQSGRLLHRRHESAGRGHEDVQCLEGKKIKIIKKNKRLMTYR